MSNRIAATRTKVQSTATRRLKPLRLFSTLLAITFILAFGIPVGV